MCVVKGLRLHPDTPIRIIGVDSNPESAGHYWCDEFAVAPRFDAPDYLETMLDLCDTYEADLFIPIVDLELQKVAANRHRFEALGCQVAVAGPEVVAACVSKIDTYEMFRRHGLPTPVTARASDATVQTWDAFPAIVKPNVGSGARGVQRVDTRQQLMVARLLARDPIVQGFVQGDEYTIDVLCDFSGRVLAAVPRLRIETRGGVCTKARTVNDPQLIRLATCVAESFELRGPACIQGIRTPDGFFLIEINPRFAGSLVMTLASGVNTPAMLVDCALGRCVVPPVGSFQPVSMVRFWDEVYYPTGGSPRDGWQLDWRRRAVIGVDPLIVSA